MDIKSFTNLGGPVGRARSVNRSENCKNHKNEEKKNRKCAVCGAMV